MTNNVEAGTIRGGVIESTHPWSAAVVADGRVVRTWGTQTDRISFSRSTIKPFQATISQEFGAQLVPQQLAVAASSHSGGPLHISLVRSMLHESGLAESDLRCPPDYPLGVLSQRRWIASGFEEQRVAHNCSGKHAGFLRSCLAQGWPLDTYIDVDHPLQRNIAELIRAVTPVNTQPTAIDGCGSPTFRTSVVSLAHAFASLSVDDRFAEVRTAMMRYPAITASNERPDGQLARWWDGPAKVGAQGLMALGRNGIGVATKSHEGSRMIATLAAVEVLRQMDMLQPHVLTALAHVARPPVFGGGVPVGQIVPDVSEVTNE